MSAPNEGQDRLDYRETVDITEVHSAIAREHAEPRAGTMPIPTWLGAVCAVALCWAGAYVGVFHGGFSSKVYNEYESSPATFFPLPGGPGESTEPSTPVPLLVLGENVFGARCATCHQATGLGNPAQQVPPLAGSEWVDGPEFGEKRLAAIVLKGLQGSISVKGATFNGQMPNWDMLKPREIAGVLSFIRQAFGNKGTGEYTEEQIKNAKKEFSSQIGAFKVEQIKAIPVDAKIEGGAPAGAPVAKAPDAKPGETAKTTTPATAPAAPGPAAAPAAGTFDIAESIKRGGPIYTVTCGLACHGPTGQGIPGAFPPLVDTPFVKENPRRMIAMVLKGIVGPLNVKGTVITSAMPPPDLTFPQLKDDKNVADVLNYVRNSFGNKNPEAVTPELVAAVRKEFAERTTMWSEAELLNFPPAK